MHLYTHRTSFTQQIQSPIYMLRPVLYPLPASTKRGTTNIVTDQNATNVEQSNVTTTA